MRATEEQVKLVSKFAKAVHKTVEAEMLDGVTPETAITFAAALEALLSERAAHEETRRRLADAEEWKAGALGAAIISDRPNTGQHTEQAYLEHRARALEGGPYLDGADVVSAVDLKRRDAEAVLEQARRELADKDMLLRVIERLLTGAVPGDIPNLHDRAVIVSHRIGDLCSLLSCEPDEVVERVKAWKNKFEIIRALPNGPDRPSAQGQIDLAVEFAEAALAPTRPAGEPTRLGAIDIEPSPCSRCGYHHSRSLQCSAGEPAETKPKFTAALERRRVLGVQDALDEAIADIESDAPPASVAEQAQGRCGRCGRVWHGPTCYGIPVVPPAKPSEGDRT